MKNLLLILVISLVFYACKTEENAQDDISPINWKQRTVETNVNDSLSQGSSYLAVYSEIYSVTEHRTINLTVTVSLRNISSVDTIYINKSDYYNTKGDLIRSYHDVPIFLKPLETIEIVIDEKDTDGGSGANFIFDWAKKPSSHEPIFDAVMISTSGQQGISFTTQGIMR